MNYLPLIIIGAPRSGTNMLRDVLDRLPGFGTWPCDEINYIWRYGNPGWSTDELPQRLANKRIAGYIESQFACLARRHNLRIVVEKTCANSLRLPYISALLPSARYIWIYRDPIDCVVSASKRWGAPMNWGYTLRKARYVPVRDIPVYGSRFIYNRLHRLTSAQGRVASWGPVFEGMREQLVNDSLMNVCAMQWRACVERSADAFADMAADNWVAVRYEQFVRDPQEELAALCRFIGLSVDQAALESVISSVTVESVGKGRRELLPDDVARIESHVAPAVNALQSLISPRKI